MQKSKRKLRHSQAYSQLYGAFAFAQATAAIIITLFPGFISMRKGLSVVMANINWLFFVSKITWPDLLKILRNVTGI